MKTCKCKICGKEYKTKAKITKYCSKECKYKGMQKSQPKKCLCCGKIFKPIGSRNSKYCSRKCYNLHYYPSEETRKKISDANKGNKYAVGNNYWKDKHHSQETIEKIRKAHKGKKLTEEHKNKISISLTGRKPSEATIQKIRISNIGKSHKFSIPFFISKEKELITKKQNGSFNGIGQINYNGINTKCSKFEQLIYEKLLLKYSHVEFQYKSDLYPFLCDFYIPELDLYIECQGTWVHGKKPFEPNNKSDLKILKKWNIQAKTSVYYKQAIYTWTIRDPLKRTIAKERKLNWIEFFNIKEFENWFKTIK